MTISIHGTVGRGGLRLYLDLEIPPGTTAVSGPNGAGKTTLLRVIAGLEALDTGFLAFDGTPADDPAKSVFTPTHERPVSMAFQDHRLFPQLSVVDNVAFALRRRGASRADARVAALAHLEAMGIAAHASLRPSALSLGQRQRVALARALATPADVLLLDEPLASVDDDSKARLRTRLLAADRRHIIWVTHDTADAAHAPHRISVNGGVVRRTSPDAHA